MVKRLTQFPVYHISKRVVLCFVFLLFVFSSKFAAFAYYMLTFFISFTKQLTLATLLRIINFRFYIISPYDKFLWLKSLFKMFFILKGFNFSLKILFLSHVSDSSCAIWPFRHLNYKKKNPFSSHFCFILVFVVFSLHSYVASDVTDSVMVIVVGNGHGDTSSNPGRDWWHFT